MIDIKKAKNEFSKYVSNYDINNGRIKLKLDHILRVSEVSEDITKNLNLSDEEIHLAELIGLFHDIGRFEQVRLYNTFNDKICGIDHADFSNKVLFENNLIRKFISENKYDELIKKAIYNHNKLSIDSNLTEKELIFAKIIRDADKIDILYTATCYDFVDIFWYNDFNIDEINNEIVKNFKNTALLQYKFVKNNADQILCFFSYIYDLYFPYSMKLVKNSKYLEIFTKRIKQTFKSPTIHKQIDEILNIANNYLEQNSINI